VMPYDGPVIDCDVHHTWPDLEHIVSRLPADARERLRERAFRLRPGTAYPGAGGANKRLDSYGPEGEPPGSSLAMAQRQLFDPFKVERAVMTFDVGHEASEPNPYLARQLARAMNDWSIETWLEAGDERVRGAVIVNTHVPEDAAAEIRRVGGHPRMAQVLLAGAGLGMPLGHPAYHAIYDAAQEVGLPIAIHVGGETAYQLSAGAQPISRLDYYGVTGQPVVHHLLSLIVHGVFERFRALNAIIVEAGVAWLPWLVTKLDAAYADLRRETPWVKRLPSEYLRERVGLTTQPLELTPAAGQLTDYLSVVPGVEDMLCFASDYPHWDADELRFIGRRIPVEWHSRLFYENACRLYGWEASTEARRALEAAA